MYTKLVSRFNKAFGFSVAGALLNRNGEEKFEKIKTSGTQENIETGLDRVKLLFTLSDHKEMHPDMAFISNMFAVSFFAGFTYGGFKEYNKAYDHFIHTNDATKFLNVNDARRKLSIYTTQALLKGGLSHGPKLAILVSTFFLTSSTVTLYRNKYGILEYSIAGAVTSSLSKFNLGIKGMFSGCISGGLAGAVIGTFIWLSTALTGKSIPNLKNYTYLVSIKNAEKLVDKNKLEDKNN